MLTKATFQVNTQIKNYQEINTEMASFDLVTAIKIIPEFTGENKDMKNFLKLIELYDKTLKVEAKPSLIEFVWHARLSPKAKNRLSTTKAPTTLTELQTVLKSIFKTSNTTQTLYSKLSHFKQNNMGVKAYSEQILNIINELNDLQIQELGEESTDTITKLNDKLALNTFQNGLNESLKPTIFAAQCKKFAEATALASQVEKPLETKIFSYNKNHHKTQKFQPNFSRANKNQNNRYNQTQTQGNQRKFEYNNKRYYNKNNNFKSTNNRFNRINFIQDTTNSLSPPGNTSDQTTE